MDGSEGDAATAFDAVVVDAGDADALPMPDGQRAVWRLSRDWRGHYFVTRVQLMPLEAPTIVARSHTEQIGGESSYLSVFGRGLTLESGERYFDGIPNLRADDGQTLLAPVSPDQAMIRDTRVLTSDGTTGTFVLALVIPDLFCFGIIDAKRVGSDFLVASRSTAWLVGADGVVREVFTWQPYQMIGFFRDGSDRILAKEVGSDGVTQFWSRDPTEGPWQREAVPTGLRDATVLGLEMNRRVWIRGVDASGRHVVAPLGSTVGTVLPESGAVTAVDREGRLVVVTASPTDRRVLAVRLDEALCDGVDGMSRIDGTYAGDGTAELVVCDGSRPCDEPVTELLELAVASDGSLLLSEGTKHYDSAWWWGTRHFWWFDPP